MSSSQYTPWIRVFHPDAMKSGHIDHFFRNSDSAVSKRGTLKIICKNFTSSRIFTWAVLSDMWVATAFFCALQHVCPAHNNGNLCVLSEFGLECITYSIGCITNNRGRSYDFLLEEQFRTMLHWLEHEAEIRFPFVLAHCNTNNMKFSVKIGCANEQYWKTLS